ncbi:unnamed protein product [Amaranthus hypochondriacus]
MEYPGLKIWVGIAFLLVFTFLLPLASGLTNSDDVAAINSLYAAFGSLLPGWAVSGGDPCGEAWQGVLCDINGNIISINLVGANLGGGLGDSLASFSSITTIDLSNNHISGSLPSKFPVSLVGFFLSDNNLTGSIPSGISTLTNLATLKLNENHLTGELPDSFHSLTSLSSIDFGHNSLSGELPPSMENLSALVSLHLQSNQLSGTLDVLQNLPLQDLNIENNLFNGPIPEKLLNIPNFKRDGNPFNTTAAPLPSPPAPSVLPSPPAPSVLPSPPDPSVLPSPPDPSVLPSPITQEAPTQSPARSGSSASSNTTSPNSSTTSSSGQTPGNHTVSPPMQSPPTQQVQKTQSAKTRRIVGISIASVIGFIILVLALLLCLPWCFRRSRAYYRATTRHEIRPYMGARESSHINGSSRYSNNQVEKVQKDAVVEIKDEPRAEVRRTAAIPKQPSEEELYSQRSETPLRKLESDMSFDMDFVMPPPPPPPPPLPPHFSSERVIVEPISSAESLAAKRSTRPLPLTSVKSFTIASLQQYTRSFSHDNLIGSGMLGTVYRAELPYGKVFAVKKLDKGVSSRLKEHEFIELVNNIDRIRHANVVDLVGYCSEHNQRLLIYEYCSNGSLQDALHADDEFRKNLSWNLRMQMALGAARALEYLHEVCEPPVVHRNFKSENILLDDEFNVRVSDCGLASLIASGSVSQLSGHLLSTYGYGAPEFESGIYTSQSDVYSFGVVMLELLTGRMSYDRTRIRGEQFLVRWAVPQLHDIDALQRMVDPSLSKEYSTKSLSHFADIIARCIQTEPEFRPLMSEVVQDLQSMLQRGSPTKSPNGD